MSITNCYLASLTVPMVINTNAWSMLWLLPLVAAISIVYKATKLTTITAKKFVKEVLILFGSIVVFMALTAVVLIVFSWLITE